MVSYTANDKPKKAHYAQWGSGRAHALLRVRCFALWHNFKIARFCGGALNSHFSAFEDLVERIVDPFIILNMRSSFAYGVPVGEVEHDTLVATTPRMFLPSFALRIGLERFNVLAITINNN